MRTIDCYQEKLRLPFKRLSAAFLFGIAALSLLTPALHAQYRTSIQGVVTDPSGAVIPGATLTLTNIGTGEKQVRTSDASGVYNFNALPADKFKLVVTKDGFQEEGSPAAATDSGAGERSQRAARSWAADTDRNGRCLHRAGYRHRDG